MISVLHKQLNHITKSHFIDIVKLAVTHLIPKEQHAYVNHPLLHDTGINQSTPITTPKTFFGKHMCGPMTFTFKHILEKFGYDVKGWYNEYGSGDYFEDHCFLMVGDHIIDLTPRQVIASDCTMDATCPYLQAVHSYAPYFIGTRDELHVWCNTLQKIHEDTYGTSVSTEFNMKHATRRWACQQPTPKTFDMPHVDSLDLYPAHYRKVYDAIEQLNLFEKK